MSVPKEFKLNIPGSSVKQSTLANQPTGNGLCIEDRNYFGVKFMGGVGSDPVGYASECPLLLTKMTVRLHYV